METIQTLEEQQTTKQPVLLFWREHKLKPEETENEHQTPKNEEQESN